MNRWTIYPSTLLLLTLLFAGCGGTKALNVAVTLSGSSDLNSTEDSNTGNAAVVRLYELSNETAFKSVTIESFWRDDVAALGTELVASPQQFLLYPSEARNLQLKPGPTTRFIGVAADLRKPDLQNWRQILPVETLKGKSLQITVVRDRVVLNVN